MWNIRIELILKKIEKEKWKKGNLNIANMGRSVGVEG
jgi:hypothetical protein